MSKPWVGKGFSDRSAFVMGVEGLPSMMRSANGVWSLGVPSADETMYEFKPVTDPIEEAALIKEASFSAPFLIPRPPGQSKS